MAEKIAALVGPGTGPLVYTGMARAILQVRAGKQQARVRVGYFDASKSEMAHSLHDVDSGDENLSFSQFVQVSCVDGPENLICNVILVEA